MDSDLQLKFMGLDPSFEVKSFTKMVAEKIHSSAPSDSTTTLVLGKCRGVIKASCRIVSKAGVFVAEVASDSPVKALRQIETKIRAQLESWKGRRFKNVKTIESTNLEV